MFQVGNQYGKHNNHAHSGRLTKIQVLILSELADKGLNALREILEKTEVGNSLKWQQLKLEATRIVLSKLAPDLVAEVGDEWQIKYDERTRGFAARLVSNGGIQVIDSRAEIDSNTGSV